MAHGRSRRIRSRIEALEPREMASTMGGGTFVLQGKGTDHIVVEQTGAETYTLNILRGRANRIGTYSGVFATITTPGGPLVGSGSITVLGARARSIFD